MRYAERIARLRSFYFDNAPELTHYLASVPPQSRMLIQGLRGSGLQAFRTVGGMVYIAASVLNGSAAGLAAAVIFGQSLLDPVLAGLAVGAVSVTISLRHQYSAYLRASRFQQFESADDS